MKSRQNDISDFDISAPYFVRKSKVWLIIYIILLIFMVYNWLVFENNGFLFFIIFFIIAIIYNYRNRKEIITIDANGITATETGTIRWNQICNCYVTYISYGKYPHCYLIVKIKNGTTLSINLDNFQYQSQQLASALNFYARREIFYCTQKNKKEDFKKYIISAAVIIGIFAFIILCMTIKNGI